MPTVATETCLAPRLLFDQPLRQGLVRSIADVLEVDIAIPNHTTLSRRGGGLTILPKCVDRAEPLHLLVGSTGLKNYGEGEWLDMKHGSRVHVGLWDDVGDRSKYRICLNRPTLTLRRGPRTVRMIARASTMLSPNVIRNCGHHSTAGDGGSKRSNGDAARSTSCRD